MGSNPIASRDLRSAQEALPNVLLDRLKLRSRRLRNKWKGTSGRTRRPPAYGGVGGEGVPRKKTTHESRWKHSRQRPRLRQQACLAGAKAFNEHADRWPSLCASLAVASGACCLLEQRAHLCHLGFFHRASVSGWLNRGSSARRRAAQPGGLFIDRDCRPLQLSW